MKTRTSSALLRTCAVAWLGLATTIAHADSGSRVPANPVFLDECGSCHAPYPARLLSAASWRTVMNDLDRHFGTDASVDAATASAIRGYLEANAGTGRKVSRDPALVRVTQSPRFLRKHDDIAASVFRSDKVKSAANCGACHASAAEGRFSDHDARIPR
jgi:hypothetical protein